MQAGTPMGYFSKYNIVGIIFQPLACKIALLCFFDNISNAVKLCSATSMH